MVVREQNTIVTSSGKLNSVEDARSEKCTHNLASASTTTSLGAIQQSLNN